ncbi:MAG: M14 family metallopeptidase [Patescibacteria group bacterium]
MKTTIITIVVLIILAVGGYFIFRGPNLDNVTPATGNNPAPTGQTQTTPATTTTQDKTQTVIGTSENGTEIVAYHYGTGEKNVLFVGGIHGGYEWNTALVAYELMDHLQANPTTIPENVSVTVIPVLNPDGLEKVTGKVGRFTAADVSKNSTTLISGRFNANNVDLNRNFDCDWKKDGVWQNRTVSGGSEPFSEAESSALKAYIENNKPAGAVVWYSAAGGVYASSCHNGVSPATLDLTKAFATASKYPAHEQFNFYEITGDAVNWLAKLNIPAISVLLTNHTDTEWTKNLAGVKAVLNYFAK